MKKQKIKLKLITHKFINTFAKKEAPTYED